MCGIAGIYQPGGERALDTPLRRMTDALIHRGPDDAGYWIDASAGIALGHRRLSIIDLSPSGHQPMPSASGRYTLVFNGEIYNFQHLRAELPRYPYRGTSDSEVMLAAFEAWGVAAAVRRMVGMFAFAVWDRAEHTLTLGRDRLGEKPLYYGWVDGVFLFGSELKALCAHPAWRGSVNRDALALLLRHNHIPAPYSIFEGIHKLPPACLMTPHTPPQPYWSAREAVENGKRDPIPAAEALDALENALKDAIRGQMVADVPLGAFLSGGVDSSTIVALMQAQSTRPVKTFSVGYTEEAFNEAPYAKAVAQHLGTDHTEVYVSPQDALAVIPQLPDLYDEPFSDSSQIPTFLVSKIARQQVTVALSGDAGDELFFGYTRYAWMMQALARLGYLPRPLVAGGARALLRIPAPLWGGASRLAGLFFRPVRRNPVNRLQRILELLPTPQPELLYRAMISHWKNPAAHVLGANEPPTALNDPAQWAQVDSFPLHMMHMDLTNYLPNDILTKVDRASMGVSLEVRVPLLDHRVVELVQRIPFALKLHEGQSKWLLRQLLYRYVPPALIERPKVGFHIPLDLWLRRELRDWAEALLDERRLREEGFFDVREIRYKWREYLSHQHNWHYYLWDVLMFQAWKERWM